jgi:hypothetical protein
MVVIAIECSDPGKGRKSQRPAEYAPPEMAADPARLVDRESTSA